jgi:hypothetical protein
MLTSEHTYNDRDLLDNALSMVRSNNRFQSKFMNIVSAMNGYAEVNYFTWKELKDIDPNVENIKEIYVTGLNTPTVQVNQFGTDSEDLYAPTLENRLAVMLAESVSSLLSENLLFKGTITFTNTSGEPIVEMIQADTFVTGIDILFYKQRFLSTFMANVVPVLTQDNQILVDLIMDASILGDTIIDISINGNPRVTYRIPTFADSTFNPMIADRQTFSKVANGYKSLIDTLTIN